MAPTLLFITGVLAGLIAGFILSRIFGRRRAGEGTAEVLGLEKQLREACAEAAVSRTDLAAITSQRDELKTSHSLALSAMDQLRSEKEHLTAKMAEAAEKLRSQESQTQFLEQARADLLTQFRSLSGQMLDGSREALLKSTKETVSEPFAKEVLQLRQQVEALQKDSNAKLSVLAETTRDLRQRSEDVQGAAQQLT